MAPEATCEFGPRLLRHITRSEVYSRRALSGSIQTAADRSVETALRGRTQEAPGFADNIADHIVAKPRPRPMIRQEIGKVMICRTALEASSSECLAAYSARQACFDALDSVLDLDRIHARLRAGEEIGGDLNLPQGVAGRLEAQNPIGAIELFLNQPRRADVKILRRGAGVAGADGNGRRRDDR